MIHRSPIPPFLIELEVAIDGNNRTVLTNNNKLMSWEEIGNIETMIRQTKDVYMEFNINDDYIERTNDEWIEAQYGVLRKISKPSPVANKDGFVYLIKSLKNGWYKIGITIDVPQRLSQIKSRCGEVELIHSHKSAESNIIESAMHTRFKDKTEFGEWFSLDENDVNEFINWLECPIK